MINPKRLFGWLATGKMPEMTALDESLAEHDKRFHPDGYKDGDRCSKRDALGDSDDTDALGDGETSFLPDDPAPQGLLDDIVAAYRVLGFDVKRNSNDDGWRINDTVGTFEFGLKDIGKSRFGDPTVAMAMSSFVLPGSEDDKVQDDAPGEILALFGWKKDGNGSVIFDKRSAKSQNQIEDEAYRVMAERGDVDRCLQMSLTRKSR